MNENELLEIIKREIEKYYSKETVKKNKKAIGFAGNDVILRTELEKNFDIKEEAEKIVVSEISLKDLAEISQGIYSSDESRKLLYSLLEGKELIFSEEGIEWRKFISAPLKLQEKYKEYEKNLEECGVKILKRMEIKEYLKDRKNCFTGKLLDLKTLKNNFNKNNNAIEVSAETTITELAKEYAAVNNIKITKR